MDSQDTSNNKIAIQNLKSTEDSLSIEKIKIEIEKKYLVESQRSYERTLDNFDRLQDIVGVMILLLIGGISIYIAFVFKQVSKQSKNLSKKIKDQDKLYENSTKRVKDQDELFVITIKQVKEIQKRVDTITKSLDKDGDELKEYLKEKKIVVTKLGEETEETKNKLKELSKNIEQREEIGEELSAEDFNYKGIKYFKQGDYINAIKEWDKAIELKPDYLFALNNKGYALFKLEKYKEAIIYFDKLKKINPEYHSLWFNIACTYSLMKNKEEMLKNLKKAIELDKKYKELAPKDKDFQEYWNDPDFIKLTE